MKNITINISVPVPYVSIDEYSRLSGIPVDTCRGMVSDGRIIIRPKQQPKEKIEVNLIAMLKDAIKNS
ncbi:DNA-binding protein [Photorhabdus laumondii subsp. laumondii]|uniref:DNA-binding protein n=2 Tax=Photorhabdus TaxID=29487 RepID=A0AAW6BKB5_9GAMM|nr:MULTISPECIES: DNA-binding protein [Photorhabdus]AXG42647.1 DNA-binding protein [Photorhabdus laumondii subsp. laumondii]MCC8384762.1 DNA-binding protein [Photorhabdus laumondii]MCC8413500.1 DNA-binding protein [Photorhabdus laumondii]MDB6372300.1 DNA-binding protein [Photorhabdus bodei]NDK96454.1 DNA-binding protein [Photorhabdus laumondii subsp. laumondii]